MPKTDEEVRTLLRDMYQNYEAARTFAKAEATRLNALRTEIFVGGPEDYMRDMEDARAGLEEALAEYWAAHRAFARTSHAMLGALAGSPHPTGSIAVNVSKFNDYLHAENEHVLSRGITKGAFAADGGNVGDGEVADGDTGADGVSMDCGHAETITLECTEVQADGKAMFSVQGEERKFFMFQDDHGTGNDQEGGYRYDWGAGKMDFSPSIRHLFPSEFNQIECWNGVDTRNMIENGGFEAGAGEAEGKIIGAEITSGHADVSIVTASPMKGAQHVNIAGDAKIEFPVVGNIRIGIPVFISLIVKRLASATGTITLAYESDAGVHSSEAFEIGDLSNDTPTIRKISFITPTAIGDSPRATIEVADLAVGTVDIDDLVHGVRSIYDSSRAITVIEGVTKFKKGDKFTSTVTIAEASSFQRMFNELFGRGVRHSGTPTFWTVS